MSQSNGNRPKQEAKKLFEKGVRRLHEGRYEEGIGLLKRARTLDTKNPEILVNLGGAYVLRGKYEQAVPVLETATEVAPEHVNAWVNLAAARLGPLEHSTPEEQDRAIAAWERALQLDDEAPNVNYMLGLVYYKRGSLERAVAHFARAIEVNPNDEDARRWLSSLTSHEDEDDAGDVTE